MKGKILPEEELVEKANIVRKKLIDQIRNTDLKYSITYQNLCDACGFGYTMRRPADRKTLGKILKYLLQEENKQKRPLLTSVVYLSGMYIQGEGFFKLLLAENIKNSRRHGLEFLKKYSYRRKLEKEVVDFWRNDSNYNRYRSKLNLDGK